MKLFLWFQVGVRACLGEVQGMVQARTSRLRVQGQEIREAAEISEAKVGNIPDGQTKDGVGWMERGSLILGPEIPRGEFKKAEEDGLIVFQHKLGKRCEK